LNSKTLWQLTGLLDIIKGYLAAVAFLNFWDYPFLTAHMSGMILLSVNGGRPIIPVGLAVEVSLSATLREIGKTIFRRNENG